MIDMITINYLSFVIIILPFSFMVSLLCELINELFTTTIIIITARAGTTISIITAAADAMVGIMFNDKVPVGNFRNLAVRNGINS